METFVKRTELPASSQELFAWHERPGALQRLTPWWEPVEVVEKSGGIRDGARLMVRIPLAGSLRSTWELVHRDFVEGRQFVDQQVRGPFAHWRHTHKIEEVGPDRSILEDRIEYALPLPPLGPAIAGRKVRARLARLFRYRHAVTFADLRAIHQYKGAGQMKVLISGSTGLVGSELCSALTASGHEIARLVRESPQSRQPEVTWHPAKGEIDLKGLEGFDGVVHLAGENIAGGRWTAAMKQRIRDSRVQGTRLLCESLAKLEHKPRVLVCASAIGVYGSRGDEVLDESSPPGGDLFLVDVCKAWESACEPALAAGIRVVNLRFGVILSPKGGALAKMLLPFKLGGGGAIGDGKQWMSWIALDDAAGAIQHCLATDSLSGPVNAVTPNPVTNHEYTKTLGKVLRRPTILPMPAFAARLAFGQMADELLLSSARVLPGKLQSTSYHFRHSELESALRHMLGK
jgi:uncharacterized protein (TIGR01777 family)